MGIYRLLVTDQSPYLLGTELTRNQGSITGAAWRHKAQGTYLKVSIQPISTQSLGHGLVDDSLRNLLVFARAPLRG